MSPYCWVLLAEELGVIWQFLYTFLVKMIFEPKLKKKIWQIFKKSRCSHSTSQFQLPTPGFIRFTRNETHNHTYKVTTTYANDETHRPSNACQLVLFGVRSSIPLGSDLFARHDFITIILGQTHTHTLTHNTHTFGYVLGTVWRSEHLNYMAWAPDSTRACRASRSSRITKFRLVCI